MAFNPLQAPYLTTVFPRFNYNFASDQYANQLDQLALLKEANRIGVNVSTAKLGLEGLGSVLGGITALGGLNQAKRQFEFDKNITRTNMNNSVQEYNTTLNDRANARAAMAGSTMSKDSLDQYKRLNQLSGI
mgnify:FL=1